MQGRDIGSWWHLARRFFEVAFARHLDGSERLDIDSWLNSEEEKAVFFSQPVADQRHAFHAAHRLSIQAPDRRDLTRAALLHDIGKRHAGLGIIRRSIASALTKLRIPLRGKHAVYIDHGFLAAEELKQLGCEEIVVEYARTHHDGRPESISRPDWVLLQSSDLPGKPPGGRSPTIR